MLPPYTVGDSEVYPPAEDSELMLRSLDRSGATRVLEIGIGSGWIAINLALEGIEVTGTDSDPRAVAFAREQARIHGVRISVHEGDMAAGVSGDFDLIYWNSPYVVSETIEDPRTDGGPDGLYWARRFLEMIRAGRVRGTQRYLLLSSRAPLADFWAEQGITPEVVGRLKLDFEELRVFRF